MARLRTWHLVPLAVLAVTAGLPAAAAAPAAAATTYTITNLGSLGGGDTVATALNNNGQVTGESDTSATVTRICGQGKHRHTCTVHPFGPAFLYSNGTMTDLGTLGGNDSEGRAINASGEVVGWAQTTAGSSDSALWSGGKVTDLTAAGLSGSVAWINDSGQIVGTDAIGSTGDSQPFLDSNGTVTQLPLPNYGPATESGSTTCSAIMINNNGVVLGGCSDPSSNLHGVVWQNGTPTDLGTLGGPQTNPYGINNLGQVVGWSMTSTDGTDGFLWSNGKMTDLGPNFFPTAINDNGVIIGGDQIYSGGTLQNLNNLVPAGSPQITDAVAINDNGQILVQDGGTALLLTPN